MSITEKDMVHKALKFCRDGNACHKCPYYAKRDCVEILEHKVTELYKSEHPEIYNKTIKKADKVEVIRCKDCKYHKVFTYKDGKAKSYCDYFSSFWDKYEVEDNNYCSRAIRKEEE